MRRFITLIALVIICFLLQTSVFSYHSLVGSSPDLILILTMSFGIMRGRTEGMLVGIFGGFLLDIFYTDYLGPFMLIYMLIGYLNGLMHRTYLTEDVMLPVIIIAMDSLSLNFIIYVCSFLLRNKTHFIKYFTSVMIPQAIYAVLITLIVYRIFVWINKRLKKKAVKR